MDIFDFREVVRSVLVGPFARQDAFLLGLDYLRAPRWRQLMCAAEVLRHRLEQLQAAEVKGE